MKKERIKILFYNRDAAGVNYFRTMTPALQLEEDHSDEFEIEIDANIPVNTPEGVEYLKKFNIIHYHRNIVGELDGMIQLAKILKENGTVLIVDIDDYWHLDRTHPFYRLSVDQELPRMIIENLKIADHVTTTTEIFAKEIRKYNKNVTVLPNGINPDIMTQFKDRRKVDEEYLRFVYMAGSCYDNQTEILTENGWKLFSDLKENEMVATLNKQTNQLEYQKPITVTDQYYIGDMYYGKNKNIDFAVTPNHKMYVHENKSLRRNKPFQFLLKEMKNIKGSNLTFQKNCSWEGDEKEFFIIPKYSGKRKKFKEVKFKMDDWLKFFGYWLGAGWTTHDGSNQVGVCGKKRGSYKILKEFYNILIQYGYNPTFTKDNVQLRVFNQQLFNYLNDFGKASNKFIPKEIKLLSTRQLNILFEYYLKADGTVRKNGRVACDTVSKRLADDISEIVLKIGSCVSTVNRGIRDSTFINENRLDDGTVVLEKRSVVGKYDSYCLNIYKTTGQKPQTTPTMSSKKIDVKNYEGRIYCVNVPNHILYVRRNGLSYWCGNSHKNDMQQMRGVINRLYSDRKTKDKFKVLLAGWDTRGETTDITFNPKFRDALIAKKLWTNKMIKRINRSQGNVDKIDIPQEIKDEFRNKVFFKDKRGILDIESVYLEYEKLLTDDYRMIENRDYVKFLNEIKEEPYENEKVFGRRWTRKANIYARVLNESDVSLAPLADNTFNRMKSPLKQVECWSRKLPIICSDIPPYNVDGVHMKNCILIPVKKNAEKFWGKAMKKLITEPNLREDLGNQLYEDFHVKYHLRTITNTRAEMYGSLVYELNKV